MNFRSTVCAIASAVVLTGCATSSFHFNHDPDNSMLTIITSPDTETQLMALVLTRSAMANGEQPNILLCSAGGDLALANPPAKYTAPLKPKNASPHGALKALIADGVQVQVCAIYLPNRPFGEEALLEGISVASPAAMGEQISQSGETVLSF
jgi:predicted peroxiredoxin